MPKYEVVTRLEHNGETYTKGDSVELKKEEALPLIRSRALLPNDKEEENQVPPEVVTGDDARATPAAKSLAEERDLKLEDVQGTGPGGQITANDVRRAAKSA